MVVTVSTTASSSRVVVTVEIEATVQSEEPAEATAEWEVVPPARPVLQTAVRDRLAKKLTSRKAVVSPKERISAAFEAGISTAALDLLVEEVVPPPSLGIQSSCWLGIRPDHTAWLAIRHRIALKQLRLEDTTRLVAFASQAEAEAFCLGLGLSTLPPSL